MIELLETHRLHYTIQVADIEQGYMDLTMFSEFSEFSEVTDVAEIGGSTLTEGGDYFVADETLTSTFEDGESGWYREGNMIEIFFINPHRRSYVDQDELDLAGISDVIDGIYLELNNYYGITRKAMEESCLVINIKRAPFFYEEKGEGLKLIFTLSQVPAPFEERDLVLTKIDGLDFLLRENVYSPFILYMAAVIKEEIRKGKENE